MNDVVNVYRIIFIKPAPVVVTITLGNPPPDISHQSGYQIRTPVALAVQIAHKMNVKPFTFCIFHQLENEYDWLTSDAAVDEALLINEYTFTEAGLRAG